MKLLRVDMNQLQVRWEPVSLLYEHLGGRALIARLLLEEVPPTGEPLGPLSKLIFTPGLLGGCSVTAAGRLSVGGKSPLTKGVKEANAGGTAGDTLGKLGIKVVVVEGRALKGNWLILRIHGDSAELLPAGDAQGLGTYATSDLLQGQYGAGSTVISIGQAGEMCMGGAGLCVTGEGGQRSNHAARGGLGAVMGSKGLKAIVIDKPLGKVVPFADAELFRTSARTFAQKLINDPKLGTKGSQHLYGTASIVAAVNEMGSLPTRNFSSGNFEGMETLCGEYLREVTLTRGGEVGTRCMPGW